MYSSCTCICASKWVVGLFSFVSLLWMYRLPTHSPAHSWPVLRQVFTQQCCSKSPAYMHIGLHVHKHVHSLSSFHTHTQHRAHNPLLQSTGCNIPVSLPALFNMTSLYGERWAHRLQGMSCRAWFKRLSLSWAHIKTAVYPNKIFHGTSKTSKSKKLEEEESIFSSSINQISDVFSRTVPLSERNVTMCDVLDL